MALPRRSSSSSDDGGSATANAAEWKRDSGWHLCAFAPTAVDVFRLQTLRAARDFAPGTSPAEPSSSSSSLCASAVVFRVPATVLRRRTMGRALTFYDVDVVGSLQRVQIIAERRRFSEPPPHPQQQLSCWRAAQWCSDVGAVSAFWGVLGVSLTRVPSVYAFAVEALRCAPGPDSVARLVAACAEGCVSRAQAQRALSCSVAHLARLTDAVLMRGGGGTSARHRALAEETRRLRGAPPRRNRLRPAKVSEAEERLLHDVEALPCVRRWATSNDGEEEEEAGEKEEEEVSLGRLEPARNLPKGSSWQRVSYCDRKKAPQVRWMLRRVRKMLSAAAVRSRCNDGGDQVIHIVDVGGGRGDLALALAGTFAGRVFVTVVDTNEESLAAGRARAEEERLLGSMQFLSADISAVASGQLLSRCDLVVGLHACGGLSEYAVNLAVARCASFIVVTCCFNKHPHLAVLTRNSEHPQLSPVSLDAICSLCAMAEKPTDPPSVARRAMKAVNAVRLAVAEKLFSQRGIKVQLDQTTFSEKYSRANCVLVGSILPAETWHAQ